MENKLQPSQPGALQAQTPNTTFNLPGNNNTYLDEQKNAKNPMEIIEGFGGVFDETYNRLTAYILRSRQIFW